MLPVVVAPRLVGVKRRMSASSTAPKPAIEVSVPRLSRMLPSLSRKKASTLTLTPTSEPSKSSPHAGRQVVGEEVGAGKADPARLPLLLELR
jgi:hypothetical protein